VACNLGGWPPDPIRIGARIAPPPSVDTADASDHTAMKNKRIAESTTVSECFAALTYQEPRPERNEDAGDHDVEAGSPGNSSTRITEPRQRRATFREPRAGSRPPVCPVADNGIARQESPPRCRAGSSVSPMVRSAQHAHWNGSSRTAPDTPADWRRSPRRTMAAKAAM